MGEEVTALEMQRLRLSSNDSNGSVHDVPREHPKEDQPQTCRRVDAVIFVTVFVAFSLFFVGVQLCRLPALAWTFVSAAPVILVLMLARMVYPAPGHHVCTALYFAVALSTASLLSLVTCAVMDSHSVSVVTNQTSTSTNTNVPTFAPSRITDAPTAMPLLVSVTDAPTFVPTFVPTPAPTRTANTNTTQPTSWAPTSAPTNATMTTTPTTTTFTPTSAPTNATVPTEMPTIITSLPTFAPTVQPSLNSTDTANTDTNSTASTSPTVP